MFFPFLHWMHLLIQQYYDVGPVFVSWLFKLCSPLFLLFYNFIFEVLIRNMFSIIILHVDYPFIFF